MQDLIKVLNYEGNNVTFKTENGVTYVSATEMAKPFGKLSKDWLKLKSAKEFISAIQSERGIVLSDLILILKGGVSAEQGTFFHEDLAIEFSRWLAPKFTIWCNDQIKQLMTSGQVSLQPKSQIDLLIESAMMLKVQEERIDKIEEKINTIAAQQTTRPDYFAIAGYAAYKGITVNLTEAATLGKKVSAICKIKNITTGKIHDPRFGQVKTYPSTVLEQVFTSHFLANSQPQTIKTR